MKDDALIIGGIAIAIVVVLMFSKDAIANSPPGQAVGGIFNQITDAIGQLGAIDPMQEGQDAGRATTDGISNVLGQIGL